MKKVINQPADFVDETMEGIVAAYHMAGATFLPMILQQLTNKANMQQARQMAALGGLARKALKGRVQMQIGRVDVADGVHAQSLACG